MDNQVMNTFNALVQSLLSNIEIIDALLSSMFPCCWEEINKNSRGSCERFFSSFFFMQKLPHMDFKISLQLSFLGCFSCLSYQIRPTWESTILGALSNA